jgi:phospholipid/cholesterol/gamma-HCH transport system permease protein
LLWDSWGRKWPEPDELLPAQRAVIERVAQFTAAPPQRRKNTWRGR